MHFIQVTNTPPEHDHLISGDELYLFRQVLSNGEAYPFTHQSKAFELIKDGKECILVAGTAAGKTLAVVIPLLLRIQNGKSQKVMFLYPALALLEDQLGTIRKVAGHVGLEDQVGYIYGGMTRHDLIRQLNKKIIVATPDAIYWFLEKNVKYSPVLFYGLCHVDEIVLDEAHLLSGLMGYNLKSFLDRIAEIRQRFLRKPRFRTHALTATPTEVVAQLSKGESIYGRSKVGTVQFEFEPPGGKPNWGEVLQEESRRGFNRMLLVLNAASTAHRLFNDHTEAGGQQTLNAFKPNFGYSGLGAVVRAMLQCAMIPSRIEEWAAVQLGDEKVPFYVFSTDTKITLQHESVLERGMDVIKDPQDGQEWEELIADRFQDNPTLTATSEAWRAWFTQVAANFPKVASKLESHLLSLKISASDASWTLRDLLRLQEPRVYLSVLQQDSALSDLPRDQIIQSLIDSGDVQLKYIRLLKGTQIPVFLYTGSMPKRSRRGLIQAFQSSDVPQAILLSTSAVEVGVDFDVDLLVTEACTGNSFLQRFGRVGRRGGQGQRVRLITQDGSITGRLQDALGKREQWSREEFSDIIHSIMRQQQYFTASAYLKLLHNHVTRRLGEVGRLLAPERDRMEEMILEAGGFRYGLRSTMPQVELLDEGISRDPFQVLATIRPDKLLAVTSPFSVAKANLYFDELIYCKRDGEVLVDQTSTLLKMKLLFYFHQGSLQAIEPTKLFRSHKSSFGYDRSLHCILNNSKTCEKLIQSDASDLEPVKPYARAVLDHPALNRYILGLGDVLLRKVHTNGGTEIKDMNGTEIVLRNQMYLIQPKLNEQNQVFQKEVESWYDYNQEIIVNPYQDYGSMQYAIGHAALDRVAGACVELYRELVNT